MQLAHAGRKASAQRPWEGGRPLEPAQDRWETIAPSAIPFGADWPAPREMTADDIARVRDGFRRGRRSAPCASASTPSSCTRAHGYLLHSFISPISNKRSDGYGGSLAGAHALSARDRAAPCAQSVPKGMPLGARITGSDWLEGGLTPDDAVAFAQGAEDRRARLSSASPPAASRAETRPTLVANMNVEFAEKVKREAGIATRTVGLIATPKQAEAIIARRQGRHGGACPRHARRSRIGAGTRPARSAPRSRVPSNISAPRPRCGRGPPIGIDRAPVDVRASATEHDHQETRLAARGNHCRHGRFRLCRRLVRRRLPCRMERDHQGRARSAG